MPTKKLILNPSGDKQKSNFKKYLFKRFSRLIILKLEGADEQFKNKKKNS